MNKHRFAKTETAAALACFMVLVAAGAVSAQSVVAIKEGTFVVDDFQNSSISLSGNQGFQFDGGVNLGSASYQAIDQCWEPQCAPGTVVDLSDVWVGGDVFGVVSFRGKTYTEIGSTSADEGLFLSVSATITMPPMSDGPVTVTVPFDFAGVFFGFDSRTLENIALAGGGTATLTLVPLAEDPSSWHIQQIVFEFTPVGRR